MAKLRNGYSLNPRALWAGEVPDGWEFFKGKYVFGERFEKGNEKNLELLSPTQKYGVIPQSMYDELSGMRAVKVKESTDLSLFKTVHIGDFCISLRSFQGGFEYSKYEGVVSPAYHILFPKKNIVDGYYKYLFKEQSFIAEMNSYCQSLRDGKNISYEDFGKTLIPYPPLTEQQAIADYLDDRCSKIDEIIAEVTASIEEYKELKQAVIFEVVTKGLDKTVPMRQSNVGWINTIPCSWNVGKLRLLAEFYNGDRSSRYPSGDDIQSEGVIFVTSNNLGNIRLNIDISTNKYITKEKYDELGGAKLRMDDIVFCLRGSVGKCSINKTFDAGTIASSLVVIRAKKINPDYLNYVLQTSRITDEAIVSAIGIGSANLAAHDISEFFVPVPSKAEQQEITNFLDVRIGDMDALISEKQALIEDLQAYKKSLIYEVVTGKRRVV